MKLNSDELIALKRALAELEDRLSWQVVSTADRIASEIDDLEEAATQEAWLDACRAELDTVRSVMGRLAQPDAIVAIL